jgi:hypothetical protein
MLYIECYRYRCKNTIYSYSVAVVTHFFHLVNEASMLMTILLALGQTIVGMIPARFAVPKTVGNVLQSRVGDIAHGLSREEGLVGR